MAETDLPMRLQVAIDMAGSHYRSGRYDDALAVLSTVAGGNAPRTAVITCPECGYVALAEIPAPAAGATPGGTDGH